jgi:hypothetical protein
MSNSIIDIKVEFNKEGYEQLIKIMTDLIKISTKDTEGKQKSIVKFTFEGDKTHIYSTGGTDAQQPTAFKSYVVDTNKIFSKIDGDLNNTHMVILDAKKLTKIMKLYLGSDKAIKGKFTCQDKGSYIHAVYLQISSSRARDNVACGEINVIKNLSIADVEGALDPSRRKFGFKFKREDLQESKQRVTITGPIYEYVSFDIYEGDIFLKQEDKWQIWLGDIQEANCNYRFNKKYLDCIDMEDVIEVNVYDMFLTITSGKSSLMVSFETSEF